MYKTLKKNLFLYLSVMLAAANIYLFSNNSNRKKGYYRVRSCTHLYFLKRAITQGILPTSSRQVQA